MSDTTILVSIILGMSVILILLATALVQSRARHRSDLASIRVVMGERHRALAHELELARSNVNIPNLDAMSDADLRACQRQFLQLSSFCQDTLQGRYARLSGDIVLAQEHERRAERTFMQLPPEFRW